MFGCRAYSLHVQLGQQVNQQDVQHIAGTPLRVWARAGVQLLGNLFAQVQATNRRGCPQPHCGESPNRRLHQIHGAYSRRPQIDVNRLPRTGSILDGEFQAYRIYFLHVQRLAFQPKAEVAESEGERILKMFKPRRAFA
jgi:hypothetical protein